MALKLDNALLDELGLGALPEHEKQQLLRQIYEKLEMNVGMRLADQMTNEQLDAFEKFVEANDDKGAFQWLETNFPNYKDVVNDEFEKLKLEIKQYAPQMLAVAAQNASQPPQPMQAQPMGQQGMPGPQQPMYPPANSDAQPYQQPQYAPQQQPAQPYSQPSTPYSQPGYGQATPYPGNPSQQPYSTPSHQQQPPTRPEQQYPPQVPPSQ